jgi:YD repeat-containing protein
LVLNKKRYAYDNRDNLIALTDAENHTTRFEYDRKNWLVKEIRPQGQQISYGYDGAGNLTGYDDGITSAIYSFDDLNRKLSETVYYRKTMGSRLHSSLYVKNEDATPLFYSRGNKDVIKRKKTVMIIFASV